MLAYVMLLMNIQIIKWRYVTGDIHCVSKKRAPFEFLWLFCVLLADLKNIWQYCSKENL